MVKYTTLAFFLILVSCGIKTNLLEDKITEVPLNNEIFKNKTFFDKKLLNQIDTTVVYEEFTKYIYKGLEKIKVNIPERLNKHDKTSTYQVYKFYNNGDVNLFVLYKNDSLKNNNIKPNYLGYRGVYYSKKNQIQIDLFTVTGYNFKKEYGIINNIIEMKGDTLFEKSTKDITSVSVYIKRKIPKEFLNYKSDW